MSDNIILKSFGKGLLNLTDKNKFNKINKGYFINQPNIEGYLYNFKSIKEPSIFIIINESTKFKYSKNYIKIDNYVFIIFNCTLENFINNINQNLVIILEASKPYLEKAEESKESIKGGLPYGYFKDKDGNIKIDTKKANEIRIYDSYLSGDSIRDIVEQINSNFSHVRDVVTDERYFNMENKIISITKLNKAKQLTELNRKNRQKQSTSMRGNSVKIDLEQRRKDNKG